MIRSVAAKEAAATLKIICAGGGPAGLYVAILAKLASARHDVTVVERNPAGATHGWGVTFGEDLLDDLYRNDAPSARQVRGAALLWSNQVVRIGGRRPVHLGGKYGYSMGRARLLAILTKRATELGVDVRFEQAVSDASQLDADLVVAADGAGSRLRTRHADHFGTTAESGRNRYVWLGTSKVFDVFTFAFEQTPAGWIWFSAYPSSGGTSTCIVECAPQTWTGLALDRLDPAAGVELLEGVFADVLDGHRLLQPADRSGPAPWLTFRHIRNITWRRDNMVLAGDAAHTTHFGIGSGTVLAMQDAIALVQALRAETDLPTALRSYDERRRAALAPVQDMAQRSMRWFEDIDSRMEQDAVPFAYSLFDRRGDQAAWRYKLHVATQIHGVREVRRRITSARRSARAVRRGELRLLSRTSAGQQR